MEEIVEQETIETEQANPNEGDRAELETEAAGFLGGGERGIVVKEGAEETPEKAEEPPAEGQSETEAEAISDEERGLLNEIRALREVSGTPFKTPADLVKSYKELQSKYTQERELVKPHQQLLDLLTRDDEFRSVAEQLVEMYKNPYLAEAYNRQYASPDVVPDPRAYDVNDAAQYKQYVEDQNAWLQRQLDNRLNTRLSSIERTQKLERQKYEFKQKYPDGDPDALLGKVNDVSRNNPVENLHKILNYDNLRSQLTEEIRKEFAGKIEKAAKTQSPQSQSTAATKISLDSILEAVSTLGPEKAVKKYGKSKVEEALRQDAENFFRS